jgi:hypothetical protein
MNKQRCKYGSHALFVLCYSVTETTDAHTLHRRKPLPQHSVLTANIRQRRERYAIVRLAASAPSPAA